MRFAITTALLGVAGLTVVAAAQTPPAAPAIARTVVAGTKLPSLGDTPLYFRVQPRPAARSLWRRSRPSTDPEHPRHRPARCPDVEAGLARWAWASDEREIVRHYTLKSFIDVWAGEHPFRRSLVRGIRITHRFNRLTSVSTVIILPSVWLTGRPSTRSGLSGEGSHVCHA